MIFEENPMVTGPDPDNAWAEQGTAGPGLAKGMKISECMSIKAGNQ